MNQKSDNAQNARSGAKSFSIQVMSLSRLGNIPLGESCAVISISSPGNIPYVDFPPNTFVTKVIADAQARQGWAVRQ